MQIRITRDGNTTTLHYPKQELLSTVFQELGIPFDMPCGGIQRCLKCKVAATGELSPLSAREEELLTPEEKEGHVRFACMCRVLGDAEVTFLHEKGTDKIVTNGLMPEFDKAPWGKKFGVSVDIGTTTVAAYLYRLKDCTLMATASEKNPQGAYGADVISRIEKSLAGEGLGLQSAISACLGRLIGELCSRGGCSSEDVDSVVIAGNTAMEYLLTNRSPVSIAAAPFEQDCFFGEWLTPGDLGLIALSTDARVYVTRCIAAYVGGDIAAAILAAQLQESQDNALLVDIGTNGEMVFVSNGRLLSCSTAAGPAFEGAAIYMGSSAVDGAISSISVENGKITAHTIGNKKARSICGSGIVDAVAAMLQCGILDETGLILEEDHEFLEFITDVSDSPAFRIPGTDVVITQNDIRAIQLAKSAICSGMLTLMHEANVTLEDVKTLYIAGGFGNFISAKSAEIIGLIPQGFAAKAKVIGNAAGTGASMMLLSEAVRSLSEKTAADTAAVELSTSPFFMDTYVECMMFEV